MKKSEYIAEVEATHGVKVQEAVARLNSADLRAYAKEIRVGRARNDTKAMFAAKVQNWHKRNLETLTSEEYMALVDVIDREETPKNTKRRTSSSGEKKSRLGQKITVPLRAPGEVKASVVIKAAGQENTQLLVTAWAAELQVIVPGTTLFLYWDEMGRYDYPRSYAKALNGGTTKVRNVAEALRIIAAKN